MIRTRRHVVSLIVVLLLSGLGVAGLTVLNARPELGLDLRGGVSVVLTAVAEEGEDVDTEVLDKTVEVIRDRVDSLGAQEPDISRSGDENIIVQLPGITDREEALRVIGRTAQLRFRPVITSVDVSGAAAAARRAGVDPGTPEFSRFVADRLAQQEGLTEEQAAQLQLSTSDPPDQPVVFASADGDTWYQLAPAAVAGDDVADAFANVSDTSGWIVNITLTDQGTDKFADVTTQLAPTGGQPGRPLAIVLDGVVESAPVVQTAITTGDAQITGTFSEAEARELALVLRTGALPIELERSQVQAVSPTLGNASLRAGLLAGLIGLGLVALYMLAFYRLLGVIVLFGLGLFTALVLGLIGLLGVTRGFTLTLAGVAGLIVSVGIAADSYIIYFERVKDELKEGKTFRSAVDRGFDSAFRTNLAGNSVAFAAALILWLLAVGPVKGFALTLGISVVLDIALMYFYTHPAVALISRNKRLAGMRTVGMREVVAAA